jgi:hypothetical protein
MPLIQQGVAIEYDGRVWRRYIFDNLGKDDPCMSQNINIPNKITDIDEKSQTLGRGNNMTFIDCIPYLLDGKSIRQSWWFEGMILLFTQDGDESLVMLEPTTINGQEIIICRPYEISKDDLITDSWTVI